MTSRNVGFEKIYLQYIIFTYRYFINKGEIILEVDLPFAFLGIRFTYWKEFKEIEYGMFEGEDAFFSQ